MIAALLILGPGLAMAAPFPTRVIDHVTLVDVQGKRLNKAVVIRNGVIVSVRPAGGAWPAPWEVIAGTGRFLVPGLVDSHVHLAHSGATVWVGDPLEANLRASLYHGVTAVADLGGPVSLYDLAAQVEAGTLLGPDIVATGPFLTEAGSHPCETAVDPELCVFIDDSNAAAAAVDLLERGAPALKVALADASFTPWPTPRLDLSALLQVTAAGAPVFAHVDTPLDLMDALDSGVSILAHPPFSGLIDAEALAAAGTAEAILSTVSAFAGVGRVLAGEVNLGDPALLVADGVLDNWTYVRAHPEVLVTGWAEESAEWSEAAASNALALHEGGAVLLPGSDAGYYFVPHGYGLHQELADLEALGMDPLDLLVATTLTARQVLGLAGGRIQRNAPADLVLLTEDPTLTTSALSSIETVFRRGTAYPREDLRTASLTSEIGVDGSACLSPSGCGAGLTCDGLRHECSPACDPPYARAGVCDSETFCMPEDALAGTPDGVCHPGNACDLYTQDCGPEPYELACAPMDEDTNLCIAAGPRGVGQTCSWESPDFACQAGLFCSWVTARCYRLCDPDAPDTCPGAPTCQRQYADGGVPWFGLCL